MPTLARIDPALCGCDLPDPSGRLIAVDVALQRGLALATPVTGTETLPLAQAIGRVLAGPTVAPLPLPPFDNAAMDGYALRIGDLQGHGPWCLPVAGRIVAGQAAVPDWPAGTALRILTGATVPPDCDGVVMQEHVAHIGDTIGLDRRPAPGQNIRRRGEDIAEGGTILPGGVEIGAREAAALAATGHASVTVRRKLRVALFCTGSELRQPGEPLGPGQIWNANRYALLGALTAPWIDLTDLGAVPDDPAALTATLAEAAAGADLVISTGGVSVGDEDHMPRLFREAGGDIHAMRIAMKPGKPLAVGRIGGAVYLGLPGNPVSAFVTWTVIGARIAAAQAGIADHAPRRMAARADFELTRRPGRCEFRPARITGTDADGAQRVRLCSPSFSARIALLAAADGLALLPAEEDRIRCGDVLEFLPFSA
jgi:molybdopterin molybdotransferase